MFVLKMDEAEIMHGRKFERVSMTLMNRALDTSILKTDDRYFSVQSETEIWPIACFEVAKESHEVLQWVFQQTQFPALIKAQDQGQLLTVEGVGNFQVEWHLSADMKSNQMFVWVETWSQCHTFMYLLQPTADQTCGGVNRKCYIGG